ncbi:MAG: hypothetical protein K2H08_03440, partial [Duncaniella sp.]|nr:hypothetical protein [Duncaniella sp.]
MKINKFLLGAFALSVGFASCSNEEPIKGENGGGTTDGEKYVSVRIQSVGDNGSRAVGEGFEEGIGNESSITPDKIRFYFFTKDGRPFVMSKTGVNGEVSNTNMVAPTEITTNNTTDGQPASMNGVLVLGTAAEGYKGNAPVYVICVANPTSSIPFEKFANQNMESLLSIEANAPTNLQANSSFVMTSSTYFDGNNLIYYTDLTGKIFDTADKAKETPADIYIERLASKVRATGLKESTVQEYNDAKELTAAKYTIHTLNAANEVEITADKNLSVELTGWRLRNTATNNYAIKNLLNSWLTAAPFDAWNISELHRSYWTNPSSSSDTDIAHVDFDIYNEAEFSNKNFIAETPTANIVYCYENTIQPASLSDRDNKSTAIVVRGIVKMDNQPVKLCKGGGDYYTE